MRLQRTTNQQIFIIYYEIQPFEDQAHTNGVTIQCDGIGALIYQLRECEKHKYQNIQITTIQSGRPAIYLPDDWKPGSKMVSEEPAEKT